jgi:hypothetical protein
MLSMNRVATQLGVDKHSLLRLIRAGKINAQRGEGRTAAWQFNEADLPTIQALLPPVPEGRYRRLPAADIPPGWITVHEAATQLGISHDAVRHRIRTKGVPTQMLRNNRLVERDAMLATGPKHQGEGSSKVRPAATVSSDKSYTVTELAKLTGRRVGSIYSLVARGKLQVATLGHGQSGMRIPASELAKLEAVPQRVYPSTRKPIGDTRLSMTELSKETGIQQNTLYTWAKQGKFSAEKVQTGPHTQRWMVDHNAALSYIKAEKPDLLQPARKAAPLVRKAEQAVAKLEQQVYQAEPVFATNGLLTDKLLELANQLRANPMLTVESCDIVVRLKG